MSKRSAQAGKEVEMDVKEKYIRVGTSLIKLVMRPLISGDYVEEKVPWSYETLRQDYGKHNLPEVEKYDGFCIIPSHTDYRKVHGTYLNQYEPLPYQPAPGEFSHIRSFLTHIFGEQIEMGYDYLQAWVKEQQRHVPAPKTPRQSGLKTQR